MNRLTASFKKLFPGGTCIEGELDHAIDGFSVLVLFGPSGSGKTTILRCLAGLETPTEGTIHFGEETWLDANHRVNLRPQQRGVGYLFQQYALFPHLNVRANIAFGIQAPREEASQRVAELVRRFELTGLEDRLPRQISGGQQQRVALARTLACRPRLLLLDEPLSSLDSNLREEVRGHLRGWLSAFALPTIIVTHDRTDALALGDQIAVLADGKILQAGPVQDVFSNPVSETVARIVGVETILEARIVREQEGITCFDVHGVEVWAHAKAHSADRPLVCIRGEDVAFRRDAEGASTIRNRWPGVIRSLTPEGPLVRVAIDCKFPLTALITKPACAELGLKVGDSGFATVKATAVHVIDR